MLRSMLYPCSRVFESDQPSAIRFGDRAVAFRTTGAYSVDPAALRASSPASRQRVTPSVRQSRSTLRRHCARLPPASTHSWISS
jgi:hypothetical protein